MSIIELRYWFLKLNGRQVELSDDKKHIVEWIPASKADRKARTKLGVYDGN